MPKDSDNIQNLPLSDLIRRCLDGHKPSWNEFMRRYKKNIINMIIKTLNRCNRPDLAIDEDIREDIFEQIFIRLYRENALEKLDDPNKVVAWLRTMARHKTLDWLKSYFSHGNLPARNGESATISLDAPIGKDDDFSYHHILSDEMKDNKKHSNELDDVIKDMEKLTEMEQWIMLLIVIFYNPLTDKEIRELAWFTGKSLKKLKQDISSIMERLLEKKEDKENELKSSARVLHLIYRLESRLLEDLNKQELTADEIKGIKDEISRRRDRMEFLLNSGNQLIRPSNEDIAEILGIPKEKSRDVSVLLHRIRKKLELMREKRSKRKKK